jgi:hypothetical protein
MSPGAQNMKTRPDALRTAENVSGSAKHENGTRRPRYRQNMKTRVDAVGTAENESGSAKYEIGSRRTQNRRKRVWERKTLKLDPTPSELPKTRPEAQNMKTGPDALRTAENVSGSAKHENRTQRPRYRLKRVQAF